MYTLQKRKKIYPLFASTVSDFYGHLFSNEIDFKNELESNEYGGFETILG